MAFIDELRTAHSASLETLRLAWEIQVENAIVAFVNDAKAKALEAAKRGERYYVSGEIDTKNLRPDRSLEDKNSGGHYELHIISSTLHRIANVDGFAVNNHGDGRSSYDTYSISISW